MRAEDDKNLVEGNSQESRRLSNETPNVLNPVSLSQVVAGGLIIRDGVCSRIRPLPLGGG